MSIVGHLWMALAISLFSSVEVVSKRVGEGIGPLWLASVRFESMALLLLIPSLIFRRSAALIRRADLLRWFTLGVIGVTLSIGCYHLAIPRMRANAAAILFSANPVFVTLFAPFVLGEKVTKRKLIGLLSGVAGIALFLARPAPGRDTVAGVLLMALAMIFFALYSVLGQPQIVRYGPVLVLGVASAVGGTLLIPIAWAFEGPPAFAFANISWLELLYLVLGATVLGYVAYFRAIERLGPTRASFYFFLKPALATLLARWLLGEAITAQLLLGMVLVLSGLACALIPERAQN